MHQTEGLNFNAADPDITGRAFVDENEPTAPGSTMNAEWANAVQQEIINAMSYANVAVDPDAATDRTNQWSQLRQAIFLSGAIGEQAIGISSITENKLQNQVVSSHKLAPDAVITDKILDSNVTLAKLASDTKILWDTATESTVPTFTPWPFANLQFINVPKGMTVTVKFLFHIFWGTQNNVRFDIEIQNGANEVIETFTAGEDQASNRVKDYYFETTFENGNDTKNETIRVVMASGTIAVLSVFSGRLHVEAKPLSIKSNFN